MRPAATSPEWPDENEGQEDQRQEDDVPARRDEDDRRHRKPDQEDEDASFHCVRLARKTELETLSRGPSRLRPCRTFR
jgi:hypothetical protein